MLRPGRCTCNKRTARSPHATVRCSSTILPGGPLRSTTAARDWATAIPLSWASARARTAQETATGDDLVRLQDLERELAARKATVSARVDELAPVQLIPLLDAEATRARALLAACRDDATAAGQWFRRSIDLFRELTTPFCLARAQLQFAELVGDTDDARAARAEAVGAFERLGAIPWLTRAGERASEAVA